MGKQAKPKEEAIRVEQETNECSLSLSADRNWMRLVVNGKLVAGFHVNYVKKVLGEGAKKTASTSKRRSREMPADI